MFVPKTNRTVVRATMTGVTKINPILSVRFFKYRMTIPIKAARKTNAITTKNR